ncbi:Beta-xylosidase [Streptomyces sp. Amel2xC10]|nr:family 43 glycosylhydrolase [Streptomyces sp. Amel2xC10]SMF81760.1 Beta-xylosidase [Streptomyces sp. Amel2xC10]
MTYPHPVTYRNPVLDADWSDPDVIRVGDDFYLTASSFSRVPGLPLLHSRDLVNWTLVGHALERLEPAAEFADRERDAGHSRPAPGGRVRLRVEIGPAARCRFTYDTGDGPRPSGPVFTATPWRWVGALLGLFALAPAGPDHAGSAAFTAFRVIPL